MTCRDGTEATGGGASELSARSPMGLKWPDHTTHTQVHGEGSNTKKQSCKDVGSLPASLDPAFNHLHSPFWCTGTVATNRTPHSFFFLSLSGTVGSCHPFPFQISAPLKGVPVRLSAAAGENGLQVRLWISLVSLNST